VAADRPFARLERLLAPGGKVVLCGAPSHWLALLITVIQRRLSPARRAAGYIAKHSNDDLRTLSLLAESGQLRPVIDRTFPLAEAAGAVRYVFERRARGKVVVTL
jgi:NADPH:quinone reductase-like Zn-dependent oxidoreductase